MNPDAPSSEKKDEFKNARVHVIVHRKPHCVIEYEVEASKPICLEAQKKASKSVGKEVVVPGFRKGKAPVEIVAKRFPQELDKRWQEEIANTCYRESAELAKIPVIRQDATVTFKMQSHSRDKAKLILSFETVPTIPSINPAKCVLEEVKRPEVSKEKVNETIRQAQMFFASWEKVEDHPVKEGDFLILDIDVIDQDPPEKLFANTRFEVSDKSMAQWMKDLVIGKKVGESIEGTSVPDETMPEEEKKEFPPKKVRVSIKSIEKSTMPELNDDFAKKLGVESVDELKKKIEALLTRKADEHVREIQRERVTEFLVNQPFDLPVSVIERETQFRIKQMLSDPNFKKQWDGSDDTKKQELINDVKKQSEKAVRLFYVCRQISADQKLDISPQDLAPPTVDPLETLLYPHAHSHDPRQPDIKQAETYSRVLLEKTEDWVIAHARTEKAKPKKTEEPAKEGPAPKKTAKKASPKKKAAPKKVAPKKTAKKATPAKKAAKKAKTAPKAKK